MKKLIVWLLAATCLVMFGNSSDALARGKKKSHSVAANPTAEDEFKKLDKDNDGSLSAKELKAGKKGAVADAAEKEFKDWDADHDGKVSLKEYKNGLKAAEPEAKKKS